ncbi:MAG TPA: Ig-like domain repeat protein [Casimicrobiaceae bacterium]
MKADRVARSLQIGLLFLWLVSPLAFAQACQGLVNCSFETPSLTLGGYVYNPSGAGVAWTFAGNSGIESNGSAWGAAAAPDGRQAAFVQATGSISQVVNLSAGSYTLSFQAARRSCCTFPFIEPVRVTVDGAQVGSLVQPASTSFAAVSIPFSVASSGSHTIAFTGTDPTDKTTFIDVVSIVAGGGGGAGPTTTSLSSSLNPSTVGVNVTFTASVTGNSPTGSVTISDGASAISGCAAVALTGSGNTRTAQCSTSGLTAGTHSISAAYSGDVANAPSTSSALSQVVNSGSPPPATVFNSVEIVSAPNSSVPVDALVSGSSATDADVALITKGAGAILADVPDNGVAGGNKRGQFATDFQRSRTYAINVASGRAATISGGADNEASGLYATVVGGFDNEASGTISLAGGQSSIASGVGSVALGYAPTASGDTSTAIGHTSVASGTDSVAIGHDNVASRDNSIAIGWNSVSDATQAVALGTQATTRGIHGALAYAGGWIANIGDAQIGTYILRIQTSNNVATTLTTDGVVPSLSRQNLLALPDDASYAFSGRIVARDLTTGDSAVWKFEGMVKRGNGAATVTQTSTVTLVARDLGAATWSFTPVADTSNGALGFVGTGQAGKTIQWVAAVETVENVGP